MINTSNNQFNWEAGEWIASYTERYRLSMLTVKENTLTGVFLNYLLTALLLTRYAYISQTLHTGKFV